MDRIDNSAFSILKLKVLSNKKWILLIQNFPRTLYTYGYESTKNRITEKYFPLSIMILAYEYFHKVF